MKDKVRGASVHFEAIYSTIQAVSHARRDIPPSYLLPPNMSLGIIVVKDDFGAVKDTFDKKWSIASRQAKQNKKFSPVWEGVLNLPIRTNDQSDAEYKAHCHQVTELWCNRYEAETMHKVLRTDVHLDEGYVDNEGNVRLNAHAHIIYDRTNDAGKVILINRASMRKIQDWTAEITGLKRGQPAAKTRRKHLHHMEFKANLKSAQLEREEGRKEGLAESKEYYELKIQQIEQEKNLEIEKLNGFYSNQIKKLNANYDTLNKDYKNLMHGHLSYIKEKNKQVHHLMQLIPKPKFQRSPAQEFMLERFRNEFQIDTESVDHLSGTELDSWIQIIQDELNNEHGPDDITDAPYE